MSQFIRDKAAATELEQKKGLSFLFAQDSAGLATDGVLTGLAVAQTATASTGVLVAAGAAVSQDTVGNGASLLGNDSQITLDVLTANPVGGVPRNDIVVFDSATVSSGTGGIRAIIGTPNASPTDPTVPATAVPLARLRHAASATTIPTAKIDDLRIFTSLFGAKPGNKRSGWNNFTGTTNASGVAVFSHGMPFTPTFVQPAQVVASTSTTTAFQVHYVDGTAGATTFTIKTFNGDGTARSSAITVSFSCFFGE